MNSENISILLICTAAITVPALSLKYATRWPLLVLVVSLLGSIFYASIGYPALNSATDFVTGPLLLALSVLWLPVILLVYYFTPTPFPYGQMPWWKILARTIFLIVFELLLLAGFLVIFNFMGFIFFAFLVIATFRYQTAARYNRVLEVISTLSAAMRQNLPLPAALQTAAMGRHDKTGWIFRRIAHWLTQGNSLAESVSKGYPQCLPQVLSAMESAEKLNQLPNTLSSLEKDLVNDSDESKKVRPVHPWYPVLVLTSVIMISMGLLIFIIPTFAGVLSEMSEGHEGLPPATQLLVNLSRAFLDWKVAALICTSIFAVYAGWSYYQFRTRISYKPGPFLNLVDRIRWFWPIQSKLERNLSTLRLIEILRPALTAGLSLPGAIAATLGAKMNICFKNRVSRWLKRVENGEDAAQSARVCGIGQSIAWALDDKTNPGQAPQLLEMLEETCRSKHNYLGNIIRSIMWPIVIVALGAFVGFIVYAMFIPLVYIIKIGVESINP